LCPTHCSTYLYLDNCAGILTFYSIEGFMKNAVWYKDSWLMKGSVAYDLYHSGKPEDKKKLEKHHKELIKNTKELMDRYG